MNRRTALTTPLALPALTGCYYSQYFDVAWDEEVQLHDGSVIVVNFKFTHQRMDRFSKYERAMLRDTTMSFDAGAPHGRVSQFFKRMQPVLLNKYQGQWYAVIVPRGSGDNPYVTGQDWGPHQNAHGQWCLKLSADSFRTIPMAEFPDAIINQNLIRNVPPAEMAAFHGRLLRLADSKAELLQKHVRHPDDRALKKSVIAPVQPQTR